MPSRTPQSRKMVPSLPASVCPFVFCRANIISVDMLLKSRHQLEPKHAERLCFCLKRASCKWSQKWRVYILRASEVGGLSRLGLGSTKEALFIWTSGSNVASGSPGDWRGMLLKNSSKDNYEPLQSTASTTRDQLMVSRMRICFCSLTNQVFLTNVSPL